MDGLTGGTTPAPPRVSVVVPCRNEAGHIDDCLDSLLDQEPVPGGFEVIVADGRSDDGTREALERRAAADSRVRVVNNPGRIVSTGLNAAIRVARGEVVVRMDAHTTYAEDYLRQCIAVLEETGADNVGGPARTSASGYVQRAIAAAYHSPFSVGGARFHDPSYEGELDTVTYGCWRKEVFDRVGLFDEELVRNQDDEHNFRLTLAGGRIWQSPRIRSWYRPRSSLPALFLQYQQYGYWKVRVIQKHGHPASWRHLVPVAFTVGALLGWPLALADRRLAAAYLAGWAAYGLASLAASVWTAARSSWSFLPALPVVFLVFHLGYGLGFARGVWDFVVARSGARAGMTTLTRPGTETPPRSPTTFGPNGSRPMSGNEREK